MTASTLQLAGPYLPDCSRGRRPRYFTARPRLRMSEVWKRRCRRSRVSIHEVSRCPSGCGGQPGFSWRKRRKWHRYSDMADVGAGDLEVYLTITDRREVIPVALDGLVSLRRANGLFGCVVGPGHVEVSGEPPPCCVTSRRCPRRLRTMPHLQLLDQLILHRDQLTRPSACPRQRRSLITSARLCRIRDHHHDQHKPTTIKNPATNGVSPRNINPAHEPREWTRLKAREGPRAGVPFPHHLRKPGRSRQAPGTTQRGM